jgi:hypothetical protein
MSRWCYVVLCGLLVGLSLAGGAEPKVVGDPTGAFREKLEGVWVRGDPQAPDRVELEFTWQKIGGPDWVNRPAIALTSYCKGEAVHQTYGPVFLERSGKKLLKWGSRMYEYRLKGKTILLKEYKYTPPFQFDDEEGSKDQPPDPDALSGEWTSRPKREGDSLRRRPVEKAVQQDGGPN